MTKFKPYSRRAITRRRAEWARGNRRLLLVSGAVWAGLTSLLTVIVVVLWPAGASRWYLLGLIHATLVGAILHLFNVAFLAHDREAVLHLRGAWGEENTRDVLQSARRKRLIWGWIDSISLRIGDLDHLVVTKNGVLAIDSKWRNHVTSTDVEEMAKSAGRGRLRADGILRSLLTKERGGHRARTQPFAVQPVVVIWGAAQRTMPEVVERDGVVFIQGRALVTWLRNHDGPPIKKDAAVDLLDRLRAFRATAWQDA